MVAVPAASPFSVNLRNKQHHKEDIIPQASTENGSNGSNGLNGSIEIEAIQINYKVGDKVVYPHHGAGKVLKKEKKEILGDRREYLTIKILHNDMTVMVPSESAGRAGLRRVIGEEEVERVLTVLRGDMSVMPKNWNRRFKHNRDKMKTGDIFELAEVVKNLSLRDHEKGLSTGEKQMFVKAKKILASELMYAKAVDEEEAAEWLEGVLAGNGEKPQKKSKAKAAAATV
jgi:CarD family transcriptional regulator